MARWTPRLRRMAVGEPDGSSSLVAACGRPDYASPRLPVSLCLVSMIDSYYFGEVLSNWIVNERKTVRKEGRSNEIFQMIRNLAVWK